MDDRIPLTINISNQEHAQTHQVHFRSKMDNRIHGAGWTVGSTSGMDDRTSLTIKRFSPDQSEHVQMHKEHQAHFRSRMDNRIYGEGWTIGSTSGRDDRTSLTIKIFSPEQSKHVQMHQDHQAHLRSKMNNRICGAGWTIGSTEWDGPLDLRKRTTILKNTSHTCRN